MLEIQAKITLEMVVMVKTLLRERVQEFQQVFQQIRNRFGTCYMDIENKLAKSPINANWVSDDSRLTN